MIPALAILLSFQLAGEIATRGLDLPLPGPVLGMLLLVASCSLVPRLSELLRPVVTGLLANLSLFFVPAGVGVVAHMAQFRDNGLAIALALTVSTALAIAAGAIAFVLVAKWTGKEEK
ncbi:CidA/LrgA family protein [Paracoccus sp. (in: a-proteobacteria)]|uniref:CidA/LrgA family protein n=1 Tax=Paracoccus sp. TaxID=267 RepID=UPI00321F8C01